MEKNNRDYTKKRNLQHYSGFTLFEAVITIIIIALIISSVSIVFNTALNSWQKARQSAQDRQQAMQVLSRLTKDFYNAACGVSDCSQDSLSLTDAGGTVFLTYTYDPAQHALTRSIPAGRSDVILNNLNNFSFNYYDVNNALLAEPISDSDVSLVKINMALPSLSLTTTTRTNRPPPLPTYNGGPYRILLYSRESNVFDKNNNFVSLDNGYGEHVILTGVCSSDANSRAPSMMDFFQSQSIFWGINLGKSLVKFDQHGNKVFTKSGAIKNVAAYLSVDQLSGNLWVFDAGSYGYIRKFDSNGNQIMEKKISVDIDARYSNVSTIKAAPDGSSYFCLFGIPSTATSVFSRMLPDGTIQNPALTRSINNDFYGLAIDHNYATRFGKPALSQYSIWVAKGDNASDPVFTVHKYVSDPVNSLNPPTLVSSTVVPDIIDGDAIYATPINLAVDPVDGSCWAWMEGKSYWPASSYHDAVLCKIDSGGNLVTFAGGKNYIKIIKAFNTGNNYYNKQFIGVDPATQNIWVANFQDGYNVYSKNGTFLFKKTTAFKADNVVTRPLP